MQRRDLLRMMAMGAALPAMPTELFAMIQEANAQVAQGYALRTLNPQQNATVVAMIDLIVPATDTPGAKGVRVNEFIDLILTEWCLPEERANFLTGLADVDKQSNELFGKKFVDATAAQRTALLRAMDEASFAARSGWRHARASTTPETFDQQMKGEFFNVFRGITLHGYYTSEVGFTQELKLEIIPGAQHGCVPVSPDKKA